MKTTQTKKRGTAMVAALAATLPLFGISTVVDTKATHNGSKEEAMVAMHMQAAQRGPGGQGGPQGGPQGGQMMRMQMSPEAAVISQIAVHKELRLSQDQVAKVGQLLEKFGPQRGPGGPGGRGPGGGPGGPGGAGPGGEPGQAGARGQAGPGAPGGFEGGPQRGNPLADELKKILDANQFARFQQLVLQFEGPAAVNRPEIAKELGLTEQQHEAIRAIMEQYRPQGGPQDGPRGGGDRQRGGGQAQGQGQGQGQPPMPPNMEEMEARRREMGEKILGVLSGEQRSKWQAMIGKPFTFEKPQMRGPGGPPPRDGQA